MKIVKSRKPPTMILAVFGRVIALATIKINIAKIGNAMLLCPARMNRVVEPLITKDDIANLQPVLRSYDPVLTTANCFTESSLHILRRLREIHTADERCVREFGSNRPSRADHNTVCRTRISRSTRQTDVTSSADSSSCDTAVPSSNPAYLNSESRKVAWAKFSPMAPTCSPPVALNPSPGPALTDQYWRTVDPAGFHKKEVEYDAPIRKGDISPPIDTTK